MMFSAIVLIGLVFVGAGGLYLLLGAMGFFNKVGNSVMEIKEDVMEKDSEDKHKKENKGRDV